MRDIDATSGTIMSGSRELTGMTVQEKKERIETAIMLSHLFYQMPGQPLLQLMRHHDGGYGLVDLDDTMTFVRNGHGAELSVPPPLVSLRELHA